MGRVVGTQLSHYRILEELGRGGMGDVYLAEDMKLSRKVALKVLPPELASGEHLGRFEREAKALAALNHPNIVHVYSVEESSGVHFITMELVHGKTLADLLPSGGFRLAQFFDIAISLADAVGAAHQQGITHRDLKPDNVMVTDEGRIKVLDFGLAKGGGWTDSHDDLATQARTQEGAIVGTLTYMSPEQATGRPVDPRSDIFSLGIIFYEMLTGVRPFQGETSGEVLAAVVKDVPPPVRELREEIPGELAKMIERCLAKEPSRRIQSALDVRKELEELRMELHSGELREPSAHRKRAPLGMRLAAVLLASVVLLGVFLGYLVRAPMDTAPRLRNPAPVTSGLAVEDHPTWSSDGGRIAYDSDQAGNWDIWVTQLGEVQAVNLTEEHAGDDRFPSWSPDGRQIAFLSRRNETWDLYTMPAVGGTARKVASLPSIPDAGLGAPRWSADGQEIAVPTFDAPRCYAEIFGVTSQTSRRIPLPSHEGSSCFELSWSPDGASFAYVDAEDWAADVTRIWVIRATGDEPIPVTDGRTNDWNPTWSEDGRYLFFLSNRGGAMDLWRQPVGKDAGPAGEPVPVTTGLGIRTAAFSPDRSRVAYSRGQRFLANLWRVPILPDRPATWADARQITFDNAWVETMDVSPDGKRLVVSSDRGGNKDLWIVPSEGGPMTQLTTEPTPEWAPRWSPDGTEIVFYAYRSGNRDIWVMPAEGGPARQLTSHPSWDGYPEWAPSGREIAFASRRSGNADVWVVAAEGGEARQITRDVANEGYPVWSPDGEWLAFESNRDGQTMWRVPAGGGEPEPLIRGPRGGIGARFSPDGSVLYFSKPAERDNNVWAFSLKEEREYPVTDLEGRPGTLMAVLTTDGTYLYFPWQQDSGDIWVMDVEEAE